MPMLTTLAVALTLSASPAAPASLDPILDGVLARTGMPGIAAAVVRDGQVVARGVRGVREAGKPAPVVPGDHFLAGSVTKPMTRMLVLRLAQAGKLDLSARLAEVLPDVPMRDVYRDVTLAEVLRHTAGLPAYTQLTPASTPGFFALAGETPREKRAAFARLVLGEEPAAARGTFAYSNAGYALLGHVAERAGGKPWEALMEEEVFRPLGMAGARIGRSEALGLGPTAAGHARTPDGYRPPPRVPPLTGALAPAGAVNLTLDDLARFAAAEVAAEAGRPTPFLGERAVKALATVREGAAEGALVLGSEGSFTAGVATWPSRGVAVVVLTNGGFSGEVVEDVVEAARAAHAPDAPPPPPRRPAQPGGPGPRLGVALRGEPDGTALVERVAPGSVGEAAGLRAGDRIVSVDGVSPGKLGPDLAAALRRPGARLEVQREGKPVALEPASAP